MKLLSFGEIIWDVFSDDAKLGGAPLNFAAHVALLGEEAWLASSVGADELGRRALAEIRALNVKTDGISTLEHQKTGQCTVTLNKGVPSYHILEDVAYDRISLERIMDEDFDVIAFGTLALRSKQNLAALEHLLERNRYREIYTDLNIRPPFYSKESIDLCLRHATICKISDEELPLVTQCIFSNTMEPDEASEEIAKQYPQLRLLVITKGEQGASCFDCVTKQTYTCASEPAALVSTVGAGDSFGAAFLTGYMRTKNIPSALKLAARLSAFVVSRTEAIPPDTKEFLGRVSPL